MSVQTLPAGLKSKVYLAVAASALLLGAMFFWPAGTFDYWQAWLYLVILIGMLVWTTNYLLTHSPDLLERRLRQKEKEASQALIIRISYVYFSLIFLLPGFDRRYGWSDVPVWLVLMADLLVALGYGIVIAVFRENRYTGRTVQVDEGQSVISTGPYAVVRHPMYVGVVMLYAATPLALGSYWAMLPTLLIIPLLVARIYNEEAVLQRDLKGYSEYMQKTRYRLIPGLW